MENDLFAKDYVFQKEEGYVLFPITSDEMDDFEIVERDAEKNERSPDFKELLRDVLTDDELGVLQTAHDIVGTIAILEIPPELEKKEMIIADVLIKAHKNIKTVLKKHGTHKGELRLQKMVFLAGENTKETIHTENGVRLKLNVENVYYSARSSTERKRIAEQVKSGEKVLVMFSGCAPFPLVISKNTEAARIVGIELNEEGHRFGLVNIKLNKIKNVELIHGDVRKIIPKLDERFDRIVMPLPHTAMQFLNLAFSVSKKGTIIHLYGFFEDNEIPEVAKKKVEDACKKHNVRCNILYVVKCGKYSPRKFRVCVDMELT